MKKTLRSLSESVSSGIPLTWLTCYDYSFARVLAETDLDLILVGDSGGMVALGYRDTTPVTMDEMVMLTSAVRRGAPEKFIVGDMPKGSYESSDEKAIDNAMAFNKIAGADAVKLEGGVLMAQRESAITSAGIPVFGHIGLTPQSATAMGGYRVVGRHANESRRILEDAVSLQEAGASALLLEAVPPKLAKQVTESLAIPVFGIGAGPHTDGQLLILHDLLGLYPDFRPKFAKCFIPEALARLTAVTTESELPRGPSFGVPLDGVLMLAWTAVTEFIAETRSRTFPDARYSYAE